MKTAFALASLALAPLSPLSQGALTKANTPYDLFTVYVQQHYAALGEVVLAEDDLSLTQTFDEILVEMDEQLAAQKHDYDFYYTRLQQFFDNVKDASSSDEYDVFLSDYVAHELDEVSYMAYSARAYSDTIFDTVEKVTAELKNSTLSSWATSQREIFEKIVLSGASPLLLTGKLNEFTKLFMENSEAANAFVRHYGDLIVLAADEFNVPEEEDDSA